MNKNIIIIVSIACATILGAVIYSIFFRSEYRMIELNPEEETIIVDDSLVAPDPTPSPTPEIIEVPEVQQTVIEAQPVEQPTGLEAYDPNDETQTVLDSGRIRQLADEYGVVNVYERMQYYNREEIIDTYGLTEELRNYAADLLAIETDPELRMFLIETVYPTYEPRLSDEPFDPAKVDTQLLELLKAPTATPITTEEWNVRQQIAGNLSNEAAVDFARLSQVNYPDDPSVQMVASANILKYGGELAPVSGAEQQDAISTLLRTMQDPNFESIANDDQRILVYEVLSSVQNNPALYEALQAQLARETNPSLVEELQSMLP